jgi:glycosyltransferase involved in cell wall biosynthesis
MKISIVTVVYNAVNDIERTIKSIINQQGVDIEYIVIDGGSTDGTLAVLEKYKSYIHKLVSEPDKGIYDAMNKGLALTTGDWVQFKNAGDWFVNGALLAFQNFAEQHPEAKVIYCNTLKVWQLEPLQTSEIVSDHKQLGVRCTVDHRTSFFKGDWHRANPYDSTLKWVADYKLLLQTSKNEPNTLVHLNKPIAYMQQGGASDSLKVYGEIFEVQTNILGADYANINKKKLLKAARRKQLKDNILKALLGEKGFQKFKARKQK